MSKQGDSVKWVDLAAQLAGQMGGIGCLHPGVRTFLKTAPSPRVLVAVSGGADSVCLLCLLYAVREQLGIELFVGHYNHAWRGEESEGDAEFVEALANGLGCHFDTERCPDAAVATSETAARNLRLDYLRRTASRRGCDCIAFGHQANDILETHLLRLARGSGTEGLAAPRPVHVFSDAPTHLRPLLHIPSASIRKRMSALGLPWREDVSNGNLAISRNALRHKVVPALAKSLDRDVLTGAVRSQGLLEEDASALRQLAEEHFPEAFSGGRALDRVALRAAPAALVRRAMAAWLQGHGLMDSVGAAWMDLLLEEIRGKGAVVRRSVGDVFIVSDRKRVFVETKFEPPAFLPRISLDCSGSIALPNGSVISAACVEVDEILRERLIAGGVDPSTEAYLCATDLESLIVRSWEPGDRFRPLGAPGSRKLKDWFVDRRISPRERKALPVVLKSDGEVIWVPGLPPADSKKILEDTKEALRLTYQPPKST